MTKPTADEVAAITDLWVELAADQRQYGSHLLADANRGPVRDAVARHVVTGELFVARDDGDDADEIAVDAEPTPPDGDVVGFVMFSLDVGSYQQDLARGIVDNVYVVPEHRNSGVGAALLAAAEADLRDRGADAVALEAMADNEAARRFYRRHGYAPHRVELEKRLDDE